MMMAAWRRTASSVALSAAAGCAINGVAEASRRKRPSRLAAFVMVVPGLLKDRMRFVTLSVLLRCRCVRNRRSFGVGCGGICNVSLHYGNDSVPVAPKWQAVNDPFGGALQVT